MTLVNFCIMDSHSCEECRLLHGKKIVSNKTCTSSRGCRCTEVSMGYVIETAVETASREAVNHPSHYGGDVTYEHIKVVRAWWPDQFAGYCLGNATKYMCRAGKKDETKTLEDLRKAEFYLRALIDFLEESSGDNE